MKKVLQLVIVLMALYGTYQLYDRFAPSEYPRWPVQPEFVLDATPPEETGPPLAAAPLPPPPPPQNQVVRIICPLCDGEGRLTYTDYRGMNHSYACPICNLAGAQTLTLRPGQYICPDCRGWGRVEKPISKERSGARRCQRCGFTGVITMQKATPTRGTPGVQVPHSKP